eukprot:9475478-Pyramimonas_sp.AAC.1
MAMRPEKCVGWSVRTPVRTEQDPPSIKTTPTSEAARSPHKKSIRAGLFSKRPGSSSNRQLSGPGVSSSLDS